LIMSDATTAKVESRQRLTAAAGRRFRERGYGGTGVDGIAQEAGFTSGAFYGHFRSKDEAFIAALTAGLGEVTALIGQLRAKHRDHWVGALADFYFTSMVTCELADGCVLPSLSAEVMRAGGHVHRAYQDGLARLVDAVADGLSQRTADRRRKNAWAIIGQLIGGVTMARAVADAETARQIAAAAKLAVLSLAGDE
jgi:TetR/AcrR family transcriptional repressor of nem operon